jgi:hypothetical protein
MYQDSAGATPGTAAEQPVGLRLDTRLGLVRGAEMVSNGAFTSGLTGWSAFGAGAALANPSGAMSITNGGAAEASAVLDGQTAVAGTWYEVTADVVSKTGGGTGYVVLGSQNLPLNAATAGTKHGFVYVVTGGGVRIAVGTNTNGDSITVDNVSIRPLPGNHATQSTSTSRATLSARVNKSSNANANPSVLTGVTSSLQAGATLTVVNDAAALAVAGLSGICTSGNVYKLDNTAGASASYAFPTDQTGSTASHTMKVWARVTGGTGGMEFSVTGAGVTTISSAAYTLLSSTATPDATSRMQIRANAGAVVYFILNDLRFAGDNVPSIPAIQVCRSATDYDTAGFLYGDDFDGVDDNLTTAAGGGGTTGFFFCAAIRVSGGAGTIRSLFSDRGTNTGYQVRINTSNQLEFIAGNGTTYIGMSTTTTLPVGETHIVTAWDDGVNFNVQVDRGTVNSLARPTVVAGASIFAIGANGGAQFFVGRTYGMVYRKDSAPTATEIARIQRYFAARAGITI